MQDTYGLINKMTKYKRSVAESTRVKIRRSCNCVRGHPQPQKIFLYLPQKPFIYNNPSLPLTPKSRLGVLCIVDPRVLKKCNRKMHRERGLTTILGAWDARSPSLARGAESPEKKYASREIISCFHAFSNFLMYIYIDASI